MKAEIIAVGDEILIGETVNNNAAEIAKMLTSIGINTVKFVVVGDAFHEIRNVLAEGLNHADLLILTGGLGPTHDDRTKDVLADFFEKPLTFYPEVFKKISKIADNMQLTMHTHLKRQAYLPEGCKIFDNPIGSAQGIGLKKNGKYLIALPGVPMEMDAIMKNEVIPFLKSFSKGSVIKVEKIHTVNIRESELFKKIENLNAIEKYAKISFLPRATGVEVRLTVTANDEITADEKINIARKHILHSIGNWVYSIGDKNLADITAEHIKKLGMTLSIAESCTGGLISHLFTNIPGSSNFFLGSVVSYANEMKTELLDVPSDFIIQHGAVSLEVAVKMAEGVRNLTGSDLSISTTGIAGPSGGTDEKPVGLVYIGIANRNHSTWKRYQSRGNRLFNKRRFAQIAINSLRMQLIEQR